MTFIEYIKMQGYELIPRKGKEDDFSTMRVLTSSYKKGNIIITWGISEHGKPPTLVSPRPCIQIKVSENEFYQHDDDATTERIMNLVSNEELLKMIESNKLKFESKELEEEIKKIIFKNEFLC